MRSATAISLLLASLATAREIPQNLQKFYQENKNGICPQPISIPYHSAQSEADTVYCKDVPSGAIFLKDDTTGYADMDIDCDGLDPSSGDCSNDPSGQAQTAFKDLVQEYGGIEDLTSSIHSYVVLGNDNSESEGNGGQKFDPKADAGIQPLSVVAVVCNDQLFYGVWGDVNGGYLTGETSIALAKRCYPDEGLNGNMGHGEHDVLYIAFPGDEAVIGKDAAWAATTPEEFEESLAAVGDRLIAKLGGGIIDGGSQGNDTGYGNGTWSHDHPWHGNGTAPWGNGTHPDNGTYPHNGTHHQHVDHDHLPKKIMSRVWRGRVKSPKRQPMLPANWLAYE